MNFSITHKLKYIILAAVTITLCSCQTRLFKNSARTVPIIIPDWDNQHYSIDDDAGAKIKSLGLSHNYDLSWGGGGFVGAGGSLSNRPHSAPGLGQVDNYELGGFATIGINTSNLSASVMATSNRNEYLLSAALIFILGSENNNGFK
jgi:hypothetical protein